MSKRVFATDTRIKCESCWQSEEGSSGFKLFRNYLTISRQIFRLFRSYLVNFAFFVIANHCCGRKESRINPIEMTNGVCIVQKIQIKANCRWNQLNLQSSTISLRTKLACDSICQNKNCSHSAVWKGFAIKKKPFDPYFNWDSD